MSAIQSNSPCIVTHWRRFSSGLWRVPEGDISAAYCADTFPKIKVFTHEGREAAYKGRVFKVGAKVLFVASDPTLAEWRHLARVLYADGGYFASGCTYTEFIGNRFDPQSENGHAARFKELAACGARAMPRAQEEMRCLLAGESTLENQPQQIDLAL